MKLVAKRTETPRREIKVVDARGVHYLWLEECSARAVCDALTELFQGELAVNPEAPTVSVLDDSMERAAGYVADIRRTLMGGRDAK